MSQTTPPLIMSYATFWQRFAAMWIDFFVLLPFGLLNLWGQAVSKPLAISLVLPIAAYFSAYHIYCHGRFGQTIGKRIMGIRVVRLNGESIGWREAWMRSSVDLVFACLWAVSSFVALSAISDTDYYGIGWRQRTHALMALHPVWLRWTQPANTIWVWSEVVVMLFNTERRAIHDFIAGTVVVQMRKASGSLVQ
jgi:uncharacterized RDD family membrane protein YckC